MKYKFGYIPSFAKELKTLCKKYKSLKKDFEALKEEIETNPNIGVSLGEGLRKIRLNISSKNKGKSGGARVITHEIWLKIKRLFRRSFESKATVRRKKVRSRWLSQRGKGNESGV